MRESGHVVNRAAVKGSWRRRAVPLTVIAAFAMTVSSASLATAGTDIHDATWYYDEWDMDAVHASGVDGSGVTVAIIDTPINVEVPTLANADVSANGLPACTLDDGRRVPGTSDNLDVSAHGTQSASLIVGSGHGYGDDAGVKGMAPGARLLSYVALPYGDNYVYCDPSHGGLESQEGYGVEAVAVAIDAAVAAGADIISVSMSTRDWPAVVEALDRAYEEGVIVVAATSNHDVSRDPDDAPSVLNGVVSVTSVDAEGRPALDFRGEPIASPNIDIAGPGVNILSQGVPGEGWESQEAWDGTSEATPIVAGGLALAMQKYPEATPNQLLQSLIRTTGNYGVHEPALDSDGHFGYGLFNLTVFLETDPTSFEDVNPFVELEPRDPADVGAWGPLASDVVEDGSPLPVALDGVYVAPEEAEAAPGTVSDTGASPSAALAVLVLAFVSVLVVAVILIYYAVKVWWYRPEVPVARTGGVPPSAPQATASALTPPALPVAQNRL